jgi:hypothetical protein
MENVGRYVKGMDDYFVRIPSYTYIVLGGGGEMAQSRHI